MKIGDWVQRTGGKWHLVESVVAGDVITRCGRRMRDDKAFEVSEVMPLTRMLCKAGCDRPDPFTEDDASTQPIDPTTDTP